MCFRKAAAAVKVQQRIRMKPVRRKVHDALVHPCRHHRGKLVRWSLFGRLGAANDLSNGRVSIDVFHLLENFLEHGRRISEADWWKDEIVVECDPYEQEDEPDDDDEAKNPPPTDHGELCNAGEEPNHMYDGSSLTSGGASASETTTTSPSNQSITSSHSHYQKVFVNRGLALWEQGREAWKSAPAVLSNHPHDDHRSMLLATGDVALLSPLSSRRRDPAAIPESFKRELVQCLEDKRHFELSQRIPLQTMIEAYQHVWNNGSHNE
jgi:hypothetical protein